jgi:signal transduction histidine kinase
LRAVTGFAALLEKRLGTSLDPEAARLLGKVLEGGARMGELIESLLELSRVGRSALSKRRLDLTAMARQVGEELRSGRGAAVEVLPLPEASGDPVLLRQVFANLIGNAIKYSSKRPDARVEVGGRVGETENVYWVKDNGAGFDRAAAKRLFGVFQRFHAAAEFEGVGIGLSLVKRILERHGGSIRAESTPGQGATFTFTLPVTP